MQSIISRNISEGDFASIFRHTAHLVGEHFLEAVVTRLAELLEAQLVFVTRALDEPTTRVKILASNQAGCQGEFDLAGTPCELVYAGQSITIEHGLWRKFAPARESGNEGFFGFPFFSPSGTCIGHLSIFFVQPSRPAPQLTDQLAFLSLRLTSELLRLESLTQLESTARRFEFQNQILKMAASHAPLDKVLTALIGGLEKEHPEMLCSIMCPDSQNLTLSVRAAPSLPPDYVNALKAVPIASASGSCGTAAFTGQRVIVEDIASHAYWRNYRHLAEQHDLRSCWSEPIGSREKLLGVFAIYKRKAGTPTQNEIAYIESFVSLSRLILSNYDALEQLTIRATTDPLTQLKNRAVLMQRLEEEFQRSIRHGKALSVLMIDLDHFKTINDAHGHATGDAVLKSAASRCQLALRNEDLIARIGGEEFAVLLPETTTEGALAVADKLRTLIARAPIATDSGLLQVTASIGIATLSQQEANHEVLLSHADEALYAAKHAGRNCLRQYPA